jgi:hypothetical protein
MEPPVEQQTHHATDEHTNNRRNTQCIARQMSQQLPEGSPHLPMYGFGHRIHRTQGHPDRRPHISAEHTAGQ